MDNFRISTEIAVQKIWFDAAKSDASKEVEDANGASAVNVVVAGWVRFAYQYL